MIQEYHTKYKGKHVKASYAGSDIDTVFTFEVDYQDLLDEDGDVATHCVDAFIMAELERVHGEKAISYVVDAALKKFM